MYLFSTYLMFYLQYFESYFQRSMSLDYCNCATMYWVLITMASAYQTQIYIIWYQSSF